MSEHFNNFLNITYKAVLPLWKMRKGDTDIEIGGFEPQTGDFENKVQNTCKIIFWRSLNIEVYYEEKLKFSRRIRGSAQKFSAKPWKRDPGRNFICYFLTHLPFNPTHLVPVLLSCPIPAMHDDLHWPSKRGAWHFSVKILDFEDSSLIMRIKTVEGCQI